MRLLTPLEVAAQLGVPLSTLYSWNSRGTGPRRVHVGRHVRFRQSDVDSWVEANLTPEPAISA